MNYFKRKWITLLRILSYGTRNFWRNAWLSIAATAVMSVTLLIILATFTAQYIGADTIQTLRQKIYISVYLNDNADIIAVEQFAKEVKSVPIVTSVEYISKDQARQDFISLHQS